MQNTCSKQAQSLNNALDILNRKDRYHMEIVFKILQNEVLPSCQCSVADHCVKTRVVGGIELVSKSQN